jgi:PadR family transcriptional regulator, regulatory protein AphA
MSLRGVLLALLSKEPNTGYGLGRQLRTELSHLWEARLQQIYVELTKLEAGGLVAVEAVNLPNRPPKKVYSLTVAGERALDEWLAERPLAVPARDERLMRLYCLERMPPELIAQRLEEWEEEWQVEEEVIEAVRSQITPAETKQLGLWLTLEATLARAKSNAAFCERAIATVSGAEARSAREGHEPFRAQGA